jgi:hypothetical protein
VGSLFELRKGNNNGCLLPNTAAAASSATGRIERDTALRQSLLPRCHSHTLATSNRVVWCAHAMSRHSCCVRYADFGMLIAVCTIYLSSNAPVASTHTSLA